MAELRCVTANRIHPGPRANGHPNMIFDNALALREHGRPTPGLAWTVVLKV